MAIGFDAYTSYANDSGTVATHSFNHSVNGTAKSVVISLNTSRNIFGGATSYSGCASTGAIDSSATGAIDGSTSISVNTTTVADNCWVVSVYGSQSGRTITEGTNTTQRFTNSGAVAMGDTNAAQTPAGSKTQAYNLSSSDVGSCCVGSIDPGTSYTIFVGFMHYTNNSDICTGVTYNGVPMTRVATATTASTRTYLYFLRQANLVSPSSSISSSASSSLSSSPSSSVSPSTSISNSPSTSVSPSTSISSSRSTSISSSVSTSISSSVSTSLSSSPSISISPSPSPADWTERTKPTTAWTRAR